MSLSIWWSLLGACVVISLTPGAGAINTMSNALSEGWRRAIWGILGQVLALVMHVAIVAAGVGLIVAQSPIVFNAIRYLGAAYLVYLGIRLMLVKTDAERSAEDSLVKPPESAWSMLRRGFWVNLLNPKAVVFFLAFMPQFIRIDQPALPQYLVFTATTVGVDLLVMWFGYAAAARPFQRLTRTPRGRRALNTTFGVLFIGVAGLLLLMH